MEQQVAISRAITGKSQDGSGVAVNVSSHEPGNKLASLAAAQDSSLPLLARFRLFRRSEEWTDAVQRLQHAMLILASIFYLRLCILQFKAFMCTTAPDPLSSTASNAAQTESLYLTEDMQTLCYKGSHATTVAFVVLLLIFYTLGFPMFCFVLLMRAFGSKRMKGKLGWMWVHCKLLQGSKASKKIQSAVPVVPHDAEKGVESAFDVVKPSASSASVAASIRSHQRARENKYGYLFFSYRPSHFAMCMLVFFVQACVAAVTVFVADDSPLLKLFLFGLLWGGQTLITAIQLPFNDWATNARKIMFGLASLVSGKQQSRRQQAKKH
jgi:hypothetical protein